MVSTIFKSGDRLVVELPAELMEALGLSEGSGVRVELDHEHGGILVAPADGVDEDFDALVRETIAKYRPALEALAKR